MANFQIHCHHCRQWLGESSRALQLKGMFESPRHRELVEGPRDTWHCKKCGWVSIFREVAIALALGRAS